MFALLHSGHPAWTVGLGTRAEAQALASRTPGARVLPWSLLTGAPELQLGLPAGQCQEILALCARLPGTPLGLTFDGGVAVTAGDYAAAERRYAEGRPGPD